MNITWSPQLGQMAHDAYQLVRLDETNAMLPPTSVSPLNQK